MPASFAQHLAWLRQTALSFPETFEENPWGDIAIKVRKKGFAFMGGGETFLSFSVKLKDSGADVLEEAFASPTHYGMGKHGWVTCRFEADMAVPRDRIVDWLDESYREVAPKTVVKKLDAAGGIRALLAQGGAPEEQPEGLELDGRHVVVLSSDALRAERAVRTIEAAGGAALSSGYEGALALVGEAVPDALIVDMGREATTLEPMLPELVQLLGDGLLVVAGIRDKKTLDRLASAGLGARFSREPPGDPDTLQRLMG